MLTLDLNLSVSKKASGWEQGLLEWWVGTWKTLIIVSSTKMCFEKSMFWCCRHHCNLSILCFSVKKGPLRNRLHRNPRNVQEFKFFLKNTYSSNINNLPMRCLYLLIRPVEIVILNRLVILAWIWVLVSSPLFSRVDSWHNYNETKIDFNLRVT